jgi:GntR family transcriptional regulator
MPQSPALTKRPLYLQVHDILADRIATGVWGPGANIPNELILAQELGVSLGTVRKALQQLEADQLIARKQGRGTFVIDHTAAEKICRFINLRGNDGERVQGVGELLSQTVRPVAAGEEAERLQVDASEPVVWTKRLRRLNGRPFQVEERCLVVSRFPGLQASAVGDYKVIVLAQKFGVHLSRACEHARLAVATPELAALLSVDVGTSLLALDRVIFSGDGLPVERRIAFCHLQDEFYLARMC